MKPFINNYGDIMDLLDDKVASVAWDEFYEERKFQAPFITQNTMPDENLVEFLCKNSNIKSAAELGCGEGRNAVYMAKQGISVTAFDISSTAIKNAKNIAKDCNVSIDFRCQDVIKNKMSGEYDFVYDSGLLHHLPPHRRITYIELLQTILKPGGFFGLTCFAWGENCADEVDDWGYYQQQFNAGVAFTKERIIELFEPNFNVIEIRKYKNHVPDTIQGLQFMWVCLFKDKHDEVYSMRFEAKQVLEALKPVFAEDPNIKRVYLFGSQARDSATISSDIDIAIVSENPSLIDRSSLLCAVDEFDTKCDFVYTTQDLIDNANRELDINYSIREEGILVWTK